MTSSYISLKEFKNMNCLMYWELRKCWFWNWAIDRVLYKENSMKETHRNVIPKIGSGPPLILVNNWKCSQCINPFVNKAFSMGIIRNSQKI